MWTIFQRSKIVYRMEINDEEQNISSITVKAFPLLFHTSINADLVHATRVWKSRFDFIGDNGRIKHIGLTSSITMNTIAVMKQINLKEKFIQGRKIAQWVDQLYIEMRDESDRFRKVEIKFNMHTSLLLSLHLLDEKLNGVYGKGIVDSKTGKLQESMITMRWIQNYYERCSILRTLQSRKLKFSSENTVQLKKENEKKLRRLKVRFENVDLVEDDVENGDETHFLFYMFDGKKIVWIRDHEDAFTHQWRPLPKFGDAFSYLQEKRNYPARGLPDNVIGVVNRTGPKSWKVNKNILESLR